MTTNQTRQAAQQQAQQARQNKQDTRAQQIAQIAAQDALQQAPNITNVPLGKPLDPTKGYSFEEGARPRDLPMPGDVPGGQPERSERDFVGNTIMPDQSLPDDHDDLVGPVGPPPGPPGNPRGPQVPKVQKADPVPDHPILTKLRQDLGIEIIKPVDVDIGGHRWTLVPLTPGDVALAANMADQVATTPNERLVVYQGAVAACTVVAIDGVPTYQVFGVDHPPGVRVTDHLRPPKQVKFTAAIRLFNFINDESRATLTDRLYEAYLDKIHSHGEVAGYLQDPSNRKVRFRCPTENCDYDLVIRPRVVPGTRDIQLPFCQWHGCAMEVAPEPSPLA